MLGTYQKLSLSKQQKKFLLLGITRELIRNSGGYIYTLEKFVEEEEKEAKKFPAKKPETLAELAHKKEIEEGGKILQNERKNMRKATGTEEIVAQLKSERYEPSLKPPQIKQQKFLPPLREARLFVPEEKLPQHLEYLKPTPSGKDVDLGKLNPLIKDPQVQVIECQGPDANITVSGTMGTKPTGIFLSRDEISDIIDRFSRESKIPVHEGVFKVVVGRLIFMAIVSEIIGSRFTIKKMFAEIPQQQLRR